MDLKRCIAGPLAAAILGGPAGTLAGQPGDMQQRGDAAATAPPATRAAPPGTGIAPAVAGGALAGRGDAASTAELEAMRGGRMSAEATLSGALSGNSAAQVATGNNVIQSGSFANASGLPVVIQNSGANVLIQNATVINLELK